MCRIVFLFIIAISLNNCGGGGGGSSSTSTSSNTISQTNFSPAPEAQKVVQNQTSSSIVIKSENITTNQLSGFSYENQREINIFINANSSAFNRQVLFYEGVTTISTPVGDLEQLENLLLTKVFNNLGEITVKHTLGNHITSLWMNIPYYGITVEVPVTNNHVYITLK